MPIMTTPQKRRIEYLVIGIIGLGLVVAGIIYLFIDIMIGLILMTVGFGIMGIYLIFFMLRAYIKKLGLSDTVTPPCLIFGGIIVATIVTLSIVNVLI
jgi:hypothetical protein